MIINSFIIYCLLNFYFLTGNFFLKFFGPKSIYRNAMPSEKIIAGIFFVNFFFLVINFFLPTQNLFILIIFFIFCFFLILKYFFLIKHNLNFFLIIAIIFSPLSIYIDPGFDAGLYHLPFQKILQDQNIHFGLSNIHNRYGLTGITNYFNSFLWNKKFVNILSSNQTILFLIFFLTIKDNLNLNKGYLNIYIVCAIFTFPIWYRYAPLQYGTSDIIFSVFIFIHFLYLSKLIFNDYDKSKDFEEIFFIFCLSTSFAFAIKPTGLLLIINLIIVFLFLYRKILNSFKKFFFDNFIFIIFIIIWFIRNLIISGCLIYPVILTCFNFDWFDLQNVLNINASIKVWNSQYLNLLGDNLLKLTPNFLFFFLSVILFLFITTKFFFNSILYFCIKYKLYIFSILFILFSISSLYLIELKNIVYLLEQKKFEEFILILKKELFYILVFFVISISVLFLNSNNKVKFSPRSQIFFKTFLPLFFFLNLFFFWLFNAPHPRLGQFLLFLFLPSILFIFVRFQNIKFNKLTSNFIYISIFFVILNLSILNNFKKFHYKDIFFYQMQIPKTDILIRNSFGYSPLNLQLQCWAEPNCYPYEDVFIYKKISSYNFYKRF